MRRVLLLATAIVSVGLAGCKADPPGKVETKTMTFAKHHIFIRNKGQTNPLPSNADTLADGKEAFSHYCVACHGMDGQNTGVPFAEHI
jgi:mono/diheme cytochrome c family protein